MTRTSGDEKCPLRETREKSETQLEDKYRTYLTVTFFITHQVAGLMTQRRSDKVYSWETEIGKSTHVDPSWWARLIFNSTKLQSQETGAKMGRGVWIIGEHRRGLWPLASLWRWRGTNALGELPMHILVEYDNQMPLLRKRSALNGPTWSQPRHEKWPVIASAERPTKDCRKIECRFANRFRLAISALVTVLKTKVP